MLLKTNHFYNSANIRRYFFHSISHSCKCISKTSTSSLCQYTCNYRINDSVFRKYSSSPIISHQSSETTRQMTAPNEKVKFQGYDLVLSRAAKIVLNMTERLSAKVLHCNCETNLIDHFGESKILDIEGITDNESYFDIGRSKRQYSKVSLVSYADNYLEILRPQSFRFIVNVQNLDAESMGLSMKELIRLITQGGYVVLGASENVWSKENMDSNLKKLDSDGVLSFLSFQIIKCDHHGVTIPYCLALCRKM